MPSLLQNMKICDTICIVEHDKHQQDPNRPLDNQEIIAAFTDARAYLYTYGLSDPMEIRGLEQPVDVVGVPFQFSAMLGESRAAEIVEKALPGEQLVGDIVLSYTGSHAIDEYPKGQFDIVPPQFNAAFSTSVDSLSADVPAGASLKRTIIQLFEGERVGDQISSVHQEYFDTRGRMIRDVPLEGLSDLDLVKNFMAQDTPIMEKHRKLLQQLARLLEP